MTTAVLVLLGILALGILVRILGLESLFSTKEDTSFPYNRRAALFSPAERSFLGVLDQAIGEKYRVFGKVRIADVAAVQRMSNKSHWQRAFNKISAKHFDFILCNPSDLSFVCAIELDDKSHAQAKRQGRDNFVVGVCAALGLPLLRFPAKRGYTMDGIRDEIAKALQANETNSMEKHRVLNCGTVTQKADDQSGG